MTRREAFKGLVVTAVAPWKTIAKSAPVAVRNPAYDLAQYGLLHDPDPYEVIQVGDRPCFDQIQTKAEAKEHFRKVLHDALRGDYSTNQTAP